MTCLRSARPMLAIPCVLVAAITAVAQDDEHRMTVRDRIAAEAEAVAPLVTTDLARAFLKTAIELPPVDDRVILYRRSDRAALTLQDAEGRSEDELVDYEERTLTEAHYYNLFSTPIAWARPLDVLASRGFESADGARILDFGFGNVAQLRMLASLGADVVGVEIVGIQSALYSLPEDQGEVRRAVAAGEGDPGSLTLAFGQWPAEERMLEDVGDAFDLIMTKNVLKYGYIHPEREADPATLIHLGVDDANFLQRAYDALNPGGYFFIYNLYPPKALEGEPYRPWAYGENPFDRDVVETAGFNVIEWNTPDSPAIHALGRALGWDAQDPANFEINFSAMYTILRKPPNGTP